jgi:hypothetical protein
MRQRDLSRPVAAVIVLLAAPAASADGRKPGFYKLRIGEVAIRTQADGRPLKSCGAARPEDGARFEISYAKASVTVNAKRWPMTNRPGRYVIVTDPDSPKSTRTEVWFEATDDANASGFWVFLGLDAKGKQTCADSYRLVGTYRAK